MIGVDMEPVDVPGVRTVRVPRANARGFAGRLLDIAQDAGAELVIPTVTEELVVLAGFQPCPRVRGITIAVAAGAAVAIANDKWSTCRRLAAAAVAVPRFALVSEVAGADDAVRRLGLPYLSKPRVGRGGRGVAVHAVAGQTTLRDFDDRTLLQEFVPGSEYAVNLYIARDPRCDVAAVLEKTALAHGHVGNAVTVRPLAAGDVAQLALRAARAIGLSGPADVDVRRRADGTPVVLEVNARFGAHCRRTPAAISALLDEHRALALAS